MKVIEVVLEEGRFAFPSCKGLLATEYADMLVGKGDNIMEVLKDATELTTDQHGEFLCEYPIIDTNFYIEFKKLIEEEYLKGA